MPARHHSTRRIRTLLSLPALLVAVVLALAPLPASSAGARTATGPAGPLPPVTPQSRVAALVQPATVFVQVVWDAQITVPSVGVFPESWMVGCTGFVVNSGGYIVTAGHCVDPGWEGARLDATEMLVDELISEHALTRAERQSVIDDVRVGNLRWRVEGTDQDSAPDRKVYVSVGGGKAQWNAASGKPAGVSARVLDVKPWSEGDVALLKIDASDLPVAVLSAQAEVQVGQPILAIGYPLSLASNNEDVQIALTNRNGQINSIDTQGEHGPGNLFYETSAAFSKGNSGGPVADNQGRIVGLISYRSTTDPAYFIVPASVIDDVIGGRFKNEPGRIDALYRQGLDDYYRGYYTDAITLFGQVLAIIPNLQPAIDKRTDAAERKQRFGDQPKPKPPAPQHSPVALVVAIGIAAMVVLLALLLAARAVRKHRMSRRVYHPAQPSAMAPLAIPAPQVFAPVDLSPPAVDAHGDPVPGPVSDEIADGVEPDAGSSEGSLSTRGHGLDVDPYRGHGDGPDTDAAGTRQSEAGVATAVALGVARFCQECGAERPATARFCPHCGSRLDQSR